MDGNDRKRFTPRLKKIFGWIPFGKTTSSPLLELNLKVSGAVIDANVLLKSKGWRNATGLGTVRNADGLADQRDASEIKFEDSCWLRWEYGDYALALAVGGTMIGSKAGKFQIADGRELYGRYNDLSRQRICWARWIWGWKRNPATGEYGNLDSLPQWVVDGLGLDAAVVEPPDTLPKTIIYQTNGYSAPAWRTGRNERMLATYAAIAESASPSGASRPAALFRLLAPFVRAVHGLDPEGMEWLSATNCPETFMQLALCVRGRGFPEASDALLWCALKDVGSRFDIPFGQEWHDIAELGKDAENCDFILMWNNEVLRNRVLLFPQDFGEQFSQMRRIIRQCCLDWLAKSKSVGNADALGVFLELVEAAKALPPVPFCGQLGDDEFDALALLGRRLHEKTRGERLGPAYREALERAAAPTPGVLPRLRDFAVFNAVVNGTESELLSSFPNPRPMPAHGYLLREAEPEEGMTHNELWRWLGTDGHGRPPFTEEDASRRFSGLSQPWPYETPRGRRARLFVPDGGEAEVFGIDTKRKSLGITFISTHDPIDGEIVRAFPQIPLAPAVDHCNWARFKLWRPWADESCAYAQIQPVLGGALTTVFTTFTCDFRYLDTISLFRVTLGFFADSVEEWGNAVRTAPPEARLDAKIAWRVDAGTVDGETVPFEIEGLGIMAGLTPVKFLKLPFAIPLYHRGDLRLEKGARIRAQGWLMADAWADLPVKDIFTALRQGN